MTRKITGVVSVILALFLSAACGVKPSAITERQAARDRLGPQDVAADFSHELGDGYLDTSVGGEAGAGRRAGGRHPPGRGPSPPGT